MWLSHWTVQIETASSEHLAQCSADGRDLVGIGTRGRTDTDKQVSVGGAQACVGFHPLQVAAPGVTLSRALGVHLELMLRIVIGTTDRYSSLWYLESRAIPGWEGTSEVLFFIGWVLLPNFK